MNQTLKKERMSAMHLVEIFYEIDEFCKQFQQMVEMNLLTDGSSKRDRAFKLSLSEVITIAIYYHESGYKTLKDYYEKHVLKYMNADFHHLVSYNRFLELRKHAMPALVAFTQLNTLKKCTGISFIDSFPLKACHARRAYSHKVLKGLAKKGKTSVGWFYGLKLHLIMNHKGEILSFFITSGNVADNNEGVLLKLTKKITGKLFGDRGYLVNQALFKKLYLNGIQLITKIRKNMKNKLISMADKLLLRKRGVIESLGNILKEALSLEHTRHRSAAGFVCHIASTLIAYNFRDKKPSIVDSVKAAAMIA